MHTIYRKHKSQTFVTKTNLYSMFMINMKIIEVKIDISYNVKKAVINYEM